MDELIDRLKKNRTCPRCGEKFNWIEKKRVGDRVYLYAVHVEKGENGIRRRRKCYLSPVDHYVYVTKTHQIREGLVFKGITDEGRALEYLIVILDYIKNKVKDKETKRVAIEMVKKFLEEIGGEEE